ncbi:MBL fold metallo-hydrolase [Roseibium aggregatum]|uniref:MBL fold metallo-hydrolase n=1 Tax=Roseibium aggregatum TaxID=187304 RepID=A0A926P2F9_9HYPH|nr:MBL fold metallo-hydrolase [Roseibium aggregatum]MBD1545801.1 MBL fold metallo-hydrolase [Roseibium aggregatum]
MSSKLMVTILGCGSSGGVPRIGNDWGACDPNEPKNRRRRCSILVEQVDENGKTSVLIDTGPDLRQQLLDADVQHLDAVLYTHPHADHLHGIDDLRALTIRHRQRMPVYMDAHTYQRALTAFDYCFRTPHGSSYPPILERHELVADKECVIGGAGGPIRFLPLEVEHGEIKSLGLRVGGIAYLPDVSDIMEKSHAGFSDLDVFIVDSLRRTPHPSHFSLDDALAWIDYLKPKKAVLTNLHNDMDYATLCGELPNHIVPAYDGMRIEAKA